MLFKDNLQVQELPSTVQQHSSSPLQQNKSVIGRSLVFLQYINYLIYYFVLSLVIDLFFVTKKQEVVFRCPIKGFSLYVQSYDANSDSTSIKI